MENSVVGQRKKRYDGLAHVTGETRFVDDVFIPGTLTVKVLRSPAVKGKIHDLDTSAAASLPGVEGIITHEDVPNNAFGLVPDQPVLAETIRYRGQPIAAVAACDERTALAALNRIKVRIEEEEPVFDPLEAMKPGAAKVRPEGNCYMYGDHPCRKVVFGDVEAGFKEADHIIEGEFRTNPVEHAPMETQVSLAVPEGKGRLTLYTVSQSLLFHHGLLAGILKMDKDDLRIKWLAERSLYDSQGDIHITFRSGTVGGSFGAKNDIHADHVTALLALKTGQPVKWRWTREEETLYSTHRGAWHIRIKDGVKKDGRIVARQVKSIRDAGAYSALNTYVVDKHCFMVTGPYSIPNVYVEGYCVYTNKTPSSSMRGFGVFPATFACEMQMNKIAAQLKIDPWELRFINAYREGDQTPTRRVLDSVHLIETLKACAEKAGVKLPDRLASMTSEKREAEA
ncbi:MAG: xanthine dehydrogenase family protein molybdopterin-binding subunit [Thermodesulfobacteriota bacterium]